MNSILVWLLSAMLGFTGAAGPVGETTVTPLDGSATASVEASVPSPAETRQTATSFANREMLPPCGTVDVTRGPSHQRLSKPRTAWACLDEALGRRGAELFTLRQRGRNVTVHTVYRARSDGQLEIWTQRGRTTPYRPLSGWRFQLCQPGEDLSAQPCAS